MANEELKKGKINYLEESLQFIESKADDILAKLEQNCQFEINLKVT